MSEPKHTPGPWDVDGPPDNQIVWSDPDTRICFLAHSAGMNDERDVANARLIAAAPELLEALKAIEDYALAYPELGMIQSLTANAIAKAGGRS